MIIKKSGWVPKKFSDNFSKENKTKFFNKIKKSCLRCLFTVEETNIETKTKIEESDEIEQIEVMHS